MMHSIWNKSRESEYIEANKGKFDDYCVVAERLDHILRAKANRHGWLKAMHTPSSATVAHFKSSR